MATTTLPILWLSAPAPMTGADTTQPITQQFNDLFTPAAAAPWPTLGGNPAVIQLTMTWIQQASMAQLRQVMSYISQNGLKLAVTAGVVPKSATGVGDNVEGYVNPPELTAMALKVQSAGGTINYLNMDGPLYYGHEATGNTEQASIATLAQQVASSVALVKAVFPQLQVGEAEGFQSVADLPQWAAAFQQATGMPLAYIDADSNGNDPNVISELETYAQAARTAGVPFGLLVDGTSADQSDAAWSLDALKLMAAAAADPLIAPGQYVTVSWDAYPDQLLPAGLSGTLEHVALEASAVLPLYASGSLSGNPGTAITLAGPSANALPAGLNAVAGGSVAVPGLTLGAAGAVNPSATFAVVLTDVSGTLAATAASGGTVVGSGTAVVTLTGTLAAVDAELAGVSYGAAATGADTIDVTAYDGQGLVGEVDVAVSVAAPVASPASGAGLTAAQAQSNVTTLMQQLGITTPAPASVATWTNALLSGIPLGAIRANLAASAAVVAELKSVAVGATGLQPSAATLASMENLLVQGETMAQLAASLLAGSPAQQQMQALYTQMLGSAPSAAEVGQLTLAYVTGASTTSLRTAIATLAAPKATLTTEYNYVYGVAPTAAQVTAMQNQMIAGASLQQVQAQLDTAARAEITTIFQQLLDRLPTAAELNVNAGRIEGGMSLSGVRGIYLYSAEEQNDLIAGYKAATGAAPPASSVPTLEGMLVAGFTLDQTNAAVATVANDYLAVTGTVASADMIAAWLGQVSGGLAVSAVRAAMVGNGFARAPTIAAYQQDFGVGPTSMAEQTMLQNDTITEPLSQVLAMLKQEAAADVPVVSGVVAAQAVAQNSQLRPFEAMSVADVIPGGNQVVTATVKLSPGAGVLLGGGFAESADGSTYTSVTAAPALVSSLLESLTFKPSAVAHNTTTGLSVTLTNAAGHSVTETIGITVDAAKSAVSQYAIYDPGNTTMAALGSPTLFVISSPSLGADVITGFNVANDMISLPAKAFANFAAVQHDLSSTPAGAVIRLDAQDTLTLPGVSAASLTAKDFLFA